MRAAGTAPGRGEKEKWSHLGDPALGGWERQGMEAKPEGNRHLHPVLVTFTVRNLPVHGS